MRTRYETKLLLTAIAFMVAAIIVALFLSSCGAVGTEHHGVKVTHISPDGYRAHIESGDADMFLEWLDDRIAEWLETTRPDYNVAQDMVFVIFDDYQFKCTSSYTGYCVGEYFYNEPFIFAAVWRKEKGQVYEDGKGLKVIGHELDHALCNCNYHHALG